MAASSLLFVKIVRKYCPALTIALLASGWGSAFSQDVNAGTPPAATGASSSASTQQAPAAARTNPQQKSVVDSSAAGKPSAQIEASKRLLEEQLSTKSREQLYREIFKTTPPKLPKQAEASLVVNDQPLGQVDILFSEDRTDFTMPAPTVIKALTGILDPEVLAKIKDRVGSEGRIAQALLDGFGLKTTFNTQEYRVEISVPPVLRGAQVHELSGAIEDPYAVEATMPSAVSAFLNVHANQQLKYYQDLTSGDSGVYHAWMRQANKKPLQPFFASFDGALNVKSVVLEGTASIQPGNEQPFVRNDVRLVFDRPKRALRMTAGDLAYATVGYQSYLRMLGVGITKDYSLQPGALTYPVSQHEFYLTEPAEVEVWVNGVLVSSMNLEAGTHDMRGFPFALGNNTVKIIIKDYSGREETMAFSFVHEPNLLAKKKSQFSFNAGVASSNESGQYKYDVKHPVLSLAYRQGVTDKLTLGASAQGALTRGLLGVGGVFAMPLGTIELDAGVGGARSTVGGYVAERLGYDDTTRTLRTFASGAVRLGYTYTHLATIPTGIKAKHRAQGLRIDAPLIWSTRVECLGRKFLERFDDTLSFSQERLRISSSVSLPLVGQFDVTVGGMYKIRDDTTNLFEVSLGFQKTWAMRLRTSAAFQYSTDAKGREANPSIVANVQWSFHAGPNGFMVNERIRKHTPTYLEQSIAGPEIPASKWDLYSNIQWEYSNPEPRPENFTAGVAARLGPEANDYEGHVGLAGNHGNIELQHVIAEPGYLRDRYLQHQTSLNLRTALVYAGRRVCLSRPIYGGFLLVRGIKNLKYNKIVVNPTEQGYDAITNIFGPAVLPINTQYQLKRVKLEPVNSSVGSVDEKTNFTLFPQYKSGFSLTIGAEQTVLVQGTLLDVDRTPFAHQNITITLKDRKDAEPIKTFTNAVGRFQFLGIGTGTYEIAPPKSMDREPILFKVPTDNKGFFKAGELVFTSKTAAAAPANQPSQPAQPEPAGALPKGFYVVGDLVDQSNAPVGYQALVISLLDDPNELPIGAFTNKRGEFQCVAKRPGVYKVAAADSTKFGTTRFEILKDKEGFIHVGTLVLPSKQQKGPNLNATADSADVPALEESMNAIGPALDGKRIYVLGSLITRTGEVLAFTSITIVSLDDLDSLPMNTFTNRVGGFQIICPKPGRYKIIAHGAESGSSVTFEIPVETKGVFHISKQTLMR